MKTYVILLNWNGWKDTIECLESLFLSTAENFSVIVCDNDSQDDSVQNLTGWANNYFRISTDWACFEQNNVDTVSSDFFNKKLLLLQNGGNLGFAGGNNTGVCFAMRDPECAYIWLLNNDTVVEPDALEQAINHMQANEKIGLCGSTLIYYDERSKVQAWGGAIYSPIRGTSKHAGAFSSPQSLPKDSKSVEASLSYVVGAAMLASREYIEKIGLMREDYFLFYEEIDWAVRGKDSFELGYAPLSIVYHKEGASIGTSSSGGSPLSIYYLFKNRIKFSSRFYKKYLPTVLVFCFIEIAKFLLKIRIASAMAAIRGMCGLSPPRRKQNL